MEIKQLKTSEVNEYRKYFRKMDNARWIEGVDLVGYWKEGDSFIFRSDEIDICISKSCLKEIIAEVEK